MGKPQTNYASDEHHTSFYNKYYLMMHPTVKYAYEIF